MSNRTMSVLVAGAFAAAVASAATPPAFAQSKADMKKMMMENQAKTKEALATAAPEQAPLVPGPTRSAKY